MMKDAARPALRVGVKVSMPAVINSAAGNITVTSAGYFFVNGSLLNWSLKSV
jgi:hypothetical protein